MKIKTAVFLLPLKLEESPDLLLLLRMLSLGQGAWDMIDSQVFKEPKMVSPFDVKNLTQLIKFRLIYYFIAFLIKHLFSKCLIRAFLGKNSGHRAAVLDMLRAFYFHGCLLLTVLKSACTSVKYSTGCSLLSHFSWSLAHNWWVCRTHLAWGKQDFQTVSNSDRSSEAFHWQEKCFFPSHLSVTAV